MASTYERIPGTSQLALGSGGFVSFGALPALTGDIRFSQAFAVRSLDGGERDVIVGAAGTLVFGNTNVGTTVKGASVTLDASAMNLAMSNGAAFNFFSSVDFGFGNSPASGKKALLITPNAIGASSVYFGMETTSSTITRQQPDADTAAKAPQPLVLAGQPPFATATVGRRNPGDVTISMPAPVTGGTVGCFNIGAALNIGFVSKAMVTDQTLTDTESLANCIETTGNNGGATRTLTINAPPAVGQCRIIDNNCTNGSVAIKFATGAATAAIPINTSAIVVGNGTDAIIRMSGT